jgi:outer membrane PBP1 activator LpoA protein
VQAPRLIRPALVATALLLAGLLGACAPSQSTRPGTTVRGAAPVEAGAGALRVAVILPEEGQHLAAADAIREGILAAYFARPAPERPELRFVAAPADAYRAVAAVQEAAQAGAAVAIGPLDKAAVTQLVNSAALPIPVLALNQGETTGSPPPNLYQFALAPEDEAEQAAERAWADGHRSAALITPAGSWGDRVQAAFRARWEALGGLVGGQAQYDLAPNDIAAAVSGALASDAGRQRHAELQQILGRRLEYTPVSTQAAAGDGCVFVAGTAPKVRELRRELHRQGGALTVYGTSSAWSGDFAAELEAGLAPIRIPDMPWLVGTEPPGGVGRTALAAAIPASARSPLRRLYPMGIDSLSLATQLDRLRTPGQSYDGQTGNLTLDAQRRVHRRLVWIELSGSGVRVLGYEGRQAALPAGPAAGAR